MMSCHRLELNKITVITSMGLLILITSLLLFILIEIPLFSSSNNINLTNIAVVINNNNKNDNKNNISVNEAKTSHFHQIPVNMNDIDKYIATNHSLCDIVFKSKILFGSHHKCGTQLLLHFLARVGIMKYLKSKCDNKHQYHSEYHTRYPGINPHVHLKNYHLTDIAINNFLNESYKSIFELQKRYRNKNKFQIFHIVIINIIRKPVETILSGYNYHKFGREKWNKIAISTLNTTKIKYNNAESLNCTQHLFMQLINKYNIKNGNNYSIQTLYSHKLSLNDGILFEYLRYLKCSFNEIYLSYLRINSLMRDINNGNNFGYDTQLMHGYNFRSEDFNNDFNKSCGILMDKIGVIDKEDRENLMNIFIGFNLNLSSNKQKKVNQKHVTDGKYNRTEQLELLLNDETRCLMLLEQTRKLGYEWDYDSFCNY